MDFDDILAGAGVRRRQKIKVRGQRRCNAGQVQRSFEQPAPGLRWEFWPEQRRHDMRRAGTTRAQHGPTARAGRGGQGDDYILGVRRHE